MRFFNQFPTYKQHDRMDCGPACLKIIAEHYGKKITLDYLREICFTNRSGTSLLSLNSAACKIGFRTESVKLEVDGLIKKGNLPCIAFWQQKHFIVIYKVTATTVYISDPAHGLLTYPKKELIKNWADEGGRGIVLILKPTDDFNRLQEGLEQKQGISTVLPYMKPHKRLVWKLVVALIIGSGLQFLFPFLTQSIVDTGIKNKDLHFIYLVLLGQLFLFMGRTVMEVFRNYMMLHLSNRLNINMLSDFFRKLMRLPLGFFDIKFVGDILQRINDHNRIEQFLTSGTLNVLFSVLSLFVFGIVLCWFSPLIFGIFAIGSLLYLFWVKLFMKKRAALDYKRFSQLSLNQEKNIELIMGMPEIKLHGAEDISHGQWQKLQNQLYGLNMQNLMLRQWQSVGASVINELKNIFITFLSAMLVVNGKLTLGAMLSISYMIGQLNAPVMQLVEFFQGLQDATLSLNRVHEIHAKPDEELNPDQGLSSVPRGDVVLKNFSFKYEKGPAAPLILNNINLTIPEGKLTAIVGSSGSGKTTLMKMLLKFYEPDQGSISICGIPFTNISVKKWRSQCGVVMQEGFIFNDTVAANIAFGQNNTVKEKIIEAARIANIHEFVEELPLKYETKIGQSGQSLSTGQKQRILIARAVYKNPSFLLLDEATSALDARNERIIVDNLGRFLKGKTVVVIAHRLSTVKNADKIVVLERGEVTEVGTHPELVEDKGFYYNLVSNQLELGA